MKYLLSLFLLAFLSIIVSAQPSTNTPYYEMRVYWAPEGKLDKLLSRFRNHSLKIFEKHNIKSIGYWVPIDNKENKLVYLLAYPSAEARDAAWKAFRADPEWIKVKAESEKEGTLVSKVTETFYKEVDYSPGVLSDQKGRIFELRTYTTTPYNLGLLNARFRNHTVALFAKHGMNNLIYMKDTGKDNNLTYFLSHASVDAAKASFTAFVADEGWKKAKESSEILANGPITSEIRSEFLVATDFSPWK
jgi:hypothetical protein